MSSTFGTLSPGQATRLQRAVGDIRARLARGRPVSAAEQEAIVRRVRGRRPARRRCAVEVAALVRAAIAREEERMQARAVARGLADVLFGMGRTVSEVEAADEHRSAYGGQVKAALFSAATFFDLYAGDPAEAAALLSVWERFLTPDEGAAEVLRLVPVLLDAPDREGAAYQALRDVRATSLGRENLWAGLEEERPWLAPADSRLCGQNT